jgi:hypothetical protein
MTFKKAVEIAQALIDADMSCSIGIGVSPNRNPRANANVAVCEMRLTTDRLRTLIELGERHEFEVHIVHNEVLLLHKPENGGT